MTFYEHKLKNFIYGETNSSVGLRITLFIPSVLYTMKPSVYTHVSA